MKDCFDEIHLTDTGSTDGSLELINDYISGAKVNPANAPIFLHHFTWVDDFAKARDASFAPVATDYVMWMDLDDVLDSAPSFIKYRDSVMHLADFWLATYHYGIDNAGSPNCSFARERVIKRNLNLKWRYFVHEGLVPVVPNRKVEIQYALTWNIVHKRSAEDLAQDKSRNLRIFEKHKDTLDGRMRYYYGKELYENQKPLEAFTELMHAIAEPDLEVHDRVMGIQYACFSAMGLNQFEKAISLAFQGLQLSPTRAELYSILGDCHLKLGKLKEAAPFYRAATECDYTGNNVIQGALFSQKDCYHHYPRNQLARIYANCEQIDRADSVIGEAMALGVNAETLSIYQEIQKVKDRMSFTQKKPRTRTQDIVITCHPNGPYEWDGGIYREKGIGGSETAAVEMAEWLSKLTSRNVFIFNNRTVSKFINGVSYQPVIEAANYFSVNEPALHIAWRHNVKLTDAPTYLWCHDLAVPGLIAKDTFEKVLALTPFHASYLENFCAVPHDKILVTRNGIEPKRFENLDTTKVPNKVVFSSSPDRGLERAILVMDQVVKAVPDATLHIYYGFENMVTNGREAEVKHLKAMIAERPWVVYHGNLEQKQLTKELASACVWLYPTKFLETFCITALEMLACKVFPVARHYGALQNTLAQADILGYAQLVHSDCETPEEIDLYAREVRYALESREWEKIKFDTNLVSWESVAKEWISQMLSEGKHGVELSA